MQHTGKHVLWKYFSNDLLAANFKWVHILEFIFYFELFKIKHRVWYSTKFLAFLSVFHIFRGSQLNSEQEKQMFTENFESSNRETSLGHEAHRPGAVKQEKMQSASVSRRIHCFSFQLFRFQGTIHPKSGWTYQRKVSLDVNTGQLRATT